MESKTKTILVVDDKPNNLSLVTSLIKPYYEVLLANSGEKALVVAKEKIPDLILLDIMMPDLSGFEVCQRLKQMKETASIPVIFLTARNSGDDFEKAYEMGGVDYVTKPINTKELLARMKTHLLINDQYTNLQELNREIASLNDNLEAEVHKRTAQLEKAVLQLEKQNHDLEQSSYVISHNLRGPVATILGLSKIFNRENLADPMNEQVFDHLETATEKLDEIVIDLSTIVSLRNNPVPELENVDLTEVIESVKEKLHSEIVASQANIETDFSSTPNLFSVKSYLENALYNLISNSIKYQSGEPPNIKIYTQQTNGTVNLCVKDNGVGINKSDLSKIFEPFKRLSTTGVGKGLGLYLVKSQIEALHGEVTVQSEPGMGSTFIISLAVAGNN